jgi:PAS domain S-box-containing protein
LPGAQQFSVGLENIVNMLAIVPAKVKLYFSYYLLGTQVTTASAHMQHNLNELGARLFEESGEALFLFDPQTQQLLEVNSMAQRLSGFSRSELLKRPVSSLLRSEVPEEEDRLRETLRSPGPFHGQEGFFLRCQNGAGWAPIQIWVSCLAADNGKLGLVRARDSSERRLALAQIKQAEDRLQSVIAHAPVCLFALDSRGVVTLAEGKGLQNFGIKPGELVGQSVFELYGSSPVIVENTRRALAGESFSSMVQAESGPGAGLWFETHYGPLWDREGKPAGTIGIATDITQRRQMEMLLAGQNRVLEMILRGDPLAEVLTALCRAVEEHARDMLCSVGCNRNPEKSETLKFL